jgi:hypothetical protein
MEVQPTRVTRALIFRLNSAKILSGEWREPEVAETQAQEVPVKSNRHLRLTIRSPV